MAHEFLYSEDVRGIEMVEFCVFGARDIRDSSAIEEKSGLNLPETYENGKPKKGGLLDVRLGSSDVQLPCATCGLDKHSRPYDCPGHFGHIEFIEPVLNGCFLDMTKNILSCVCLRCSKLLINDERENVLALLSQYKRRRIRFAVLRKIVSNARFCNRDKKGCGAPVPKIQISTKSTGVVQLVAVWNDGKPGEGEGAQEGQQTTETKTADGKRKEIEELLPRRVYDILANISREDWELMGFDWNKKRPEDFMIKYMPIAPVAIRPSIKLDMLSSTPREDALTVKYADIMKSHGRLKKQKEKELATDSTKHSADYIHLLQYDVISFYDNESGVLPKTEQKSGVPLKSVCARLKGKAGRFRNNLMGKRTDHCARSVITSDPNLSIDELGVPIKIAMTCTFPETVTPENIDRMRQLVANGRNVYPGANYANIIDVNTGERKRKDLRIKNSYTIQVGDVIERHLQDGDTVLFNRQPSLHKLSIMCFRVRVMRQENINTFRINVSVTTPFNADFDGDILAPFPDVERS